MPTLLKNVVLLPNYLQNCLQIFMAFPISHSFESWRNFAKCLPALGRGRR